MERICTGECALVLLHVILLGQDLGPKHHMTRCHAEQSASVAQPDPSLLQSDGVATALLSNL